MTDWDSWLLFYRPLSARQTAPGAALPLLSGPSYHALQAGDFVGAVAAASAEGILQDVTPFDIAAPSADIEKAIRGSLEKYISNRGEEAKSSALLFGVSAFLAATVDGWVGPALASPVPPQFTGVEADKVQRFATDALTTDGEAMYAKTPSAAYLFLARAILVLSHDLIATCPTAALWASRCVYAHQQHLDRTSSTLHAELGRLDALVQQSLDSIPTAIRACVHLEAAVHSYFFREVAAANDAIERARDAAGLSVQLSGAMGKRTKFQLREIAQLRLEATSASADAAAIIPDDHLPQDVPLDDDTLLPSIKFAEDGAPARLTPLEQAVVLGLCTNVRNTNPRHGLTSEEMLPYLTYVASQPLAWALQTMALLGRSRLEEERTRTMMRSLLQMQSLADDFPKPSPPALERLQWLFCVAMPPLWKRLHELGRRYMALGVPRDALPIFEKLELWNDLIDCLQILQQDGRAEEIVRQRLEVDPTPVLWCVLGDLTRNEEHYQTAWELSKHRSSRAMRSLGYFLLRRAEKTKELGTIDADTYKRAAEAFEKCTALNVLQADVWFSLGCCALRIEDYPLAARAFRHRVDIDPDDHESWNNLANALIKCGHKPRAYLALKEALKWDFENWKVWENLCAVSVDIGAFRDVIYAMERIMEIKKTFADHEILNILVRAIGEGITDAEGTSAGGLVPVLVAMLDRLPGVKVNDHRVWSAAAIGYGHAGDARRALDCRRNAHRDARQAAGWEKSAPLLRDVLTTGIAVVQGYIASGADTDLGSARLMVRSLTAAAAASPHAEDPVIASLRNELAELAAALKK
eukprot:m.241432 g.241432  ORF g.241432 m.241432 type:complete len:810 (+) comp13851_c0_seq1:3-2432(+)